MIISASRRTDIPAFYAEWFARRVREGHCLVQNPWNRKQWTRISLLREDVDAFVFWSKNPRPFVSCLDGLLEAGYRSAFLLTVNGYPPPLEGNVPSLERRIAGFRELASRVGADATAWRYDPIALSARFDGAWHEDAFGSIAERLQGHTRRVIVSAIDFYARTERRVKQIERETGDVFDRDPISNPAFPRLARSMIENAARYGMTIASCCEDPRFLDFGVAPGACIDAAWLERAFGGRFERRKDPGQRKGCLCAVSRDIGATDTCVHGCAYCYAVASPDLAQKRFHAHRSEAPDLAGTL